MDEEEKKFEGFVPPTRNYFHMPNVWIDISAEIDNLSELKVIQYVLRHTWGYREYDGTPRPITTDEFMLGRKYTHGERKGQRIDKGTGLSNKSVVEGLKRAVRHGYLVCVKDETDKARIVKSYALNMADSDERKNLQVSYVGSTHQPDMNILHSGYVDPSHPDMKDLHSDCEESTQRSEKETKERHIRKTERKKDPAPTSQPATELLSLSPSSNYLLESLTEEESTFWTRWCAVSGSAHDSLNQNAYKHVKTLAEKGLTTEDLQSLYDAAYARIREFSQGTGKDPVPPRLGNLVNALPDWEKTRQLKKRDQELEQKQREHVSGSGNVRNFTQERLAGKAQPLTYTPLPRPERKPASSNGLGLSKMYEELQARRRMSTES